MNQRTGPLPAPFPRGLATGAAFCDRETERAEIGRRLADGVHTWLAAPRRYGKTSLLHQSLLDAGRRRRGPRLRGIVLDLLPSYDQTSLTRTLLEGVGEAAAAVLSPRRRLLEAAAEYLGRLRPKLTLSPGGPRLELSAGASPPETIVDALTGLDRLAAAAGARIGFVCDEFQQVVSLRDGMAVEAAIRHGAERAKMVTYVFSGSHRHLLESLFTDRSRPLFHLCESMALERIEAGAYDEHLQRCARLRWNTSLGPDVLDRILACTERHPHYVNVLCAHLWRREACTDAAGVDAAWDEVVRSQRGFLASEVERLSPTQRAVVATLAESPSRALTGKEFVVRTRLAKSSLAQAVESLERTARIRRDVEGTWTVLDPALARYLRDTGVEVPV